MTQNNLYMEDDEMMLYVDVQPLYTDALENSKNSSEQSAQSAQNSAVSASNSLNSIINYKNNLELFYAQANNNLTALLNNSLTSLTNAKNTALENVQSLKNTVLNNINTTLQNALNSINTIGQNIINQAKGYAQDAQNTVDNRVSEDYLIQSNALKSGTVSDISNVLAEIKTYAHSTFDRSKFTVVGSPNITSDGILSVKRNNYIQAGLSVLQALEQANTWEIKLKGIVPPIGAGNVCILGSILSNFNIFLGRGNANDNLFLRFWVDNNGTYEEIVGYTSFINYVGKKYECTISFNGTKYLAHFILEDGTSKDIEIISSNKITTQDSSRSNNLQIGYVADYVTSFVDGSYSIDLKQFSITVDGVEVFSGNKTGIDTIKPDDYTVVGTPTISADGVLNFSNGSNYPHNNAINSFNTSTNWDIIVPVKISAWGASETVAYYDFLNLYSGTLNGNVLRLYLQTSTTRAELVCNIKNSSLNNIYSLTVTGNLTIGQQYYVKISRKGNTYGVYYRTDNTDWTLFEPNRLITNSTDMGTFNDIRFINVPNLAQIDLNTFKIYVDGDLVYQPCLKIPYTESKTGSKIVNSIYRPRVNDMAIQFGYANYYTLDEANGNFTLPQGEIYGMIENLRKLIIDRTSS